MTEDVDDGEICIKHAPGICCPDYDCLYGEWDGKTCRGCGSDCGQCEIGKRKKTD